MTKVCWVTTIQSVTSTVIVYALESNVYVSLSVCLHCIQPGTHSGGNLWGIANRILYSSNGNSSNSGIQFQSNACSVHLPGTCCNQTCNVSGHSHCDVTTIIQPIGTRGQKWDSAESPNQYTLIDMFMVAAAITAIKSFSICVSLLVRCLLVQSSQHAYQ